MREFRHITTLEDPRVAAYRGVRDADLRGGGGRSPLGGESNKRFVVESELVVRRLIHSNRFQIRSLLLSPARLALLEKTISILPDTVPVFIAEEPLMRAIAGYRHHGGALAIGTRPDAAATGLDGMIARLRATVAHAPMTLLLLEGLTNVDNVGAIFRTAAGFGATAIILDDRCADPLFRLASRVSMGHVFTMPWAVSAAWSDDLNRLKRDLGVRLIAAEARPDAAPVWMMGRQERVAIVLGQEKHGLSEATLSLCEEVCAIPMSPGVPSINVAAAAAVFLYERNRTRSGPFVSP